MDPLESLWTAQDVTQIILIALTFLIMLYAVYLMNRKIRLIESDLSSIKNDTRLISEELETIAPKLRELANKG